MSYCDRNIHNHNCVKWERTGWHNAWIGSSPSHLGKNTCILWSGHVVIHVCGNDPLNMNKMQIVNANKMQIALQSTHKERKERNDG